MWTWRIVYGLCWKVRLRVSTCSSILIPEQGRSVCTLAFVPSTPSLPASLSYTAGYSLHPPQVRAWLYETRSVLFHTLRWSD